jgi:hypothetical protein
VIDNFAPQPYPLECSTEEGIWRLVFGWRQTGDGRIVPTVQAADGSLVTVGADVLQYRVTGGGPIVGPQRRVSAPTVQPARRERRPEAT